MLEFNFALVGLALVCELIGIGVLLLVLFASTSGVEPESLGFLAELAGSEVILVAAAAVVGAVVVVVVSVSLGDALLGLLPLGRLGNLTNLPLVGLAGERVELL